MKKTQNTKETGEFLSLLITWNARMSNALEAQDPDKTLAAFNGAVQALGKDSHSFGTRWFFSAAQYATPAVLIGMARHVDVSDDPDSYGYTPMHRACAENMATLVALSLSVEARDGFGATPLMSQCEKALQTNAHAHNVEKVRELLRLGANPNVLNDQGQTSLMVALRVSAPCPEIVELLLDHGADLHARDVRGTTALLHAVDTGKGAFLEPLLRRGATFDNATVQLPAAVRVAIADDLPATLDCLRGHGLDPASSTDYLLHAAFITDSAKAALWLLEAGCDPHGKNLAGRTLKDLKKKGPTCYAVVQTYLLRQSALDAISHLHEENSSNANEFTTLSAGPG